MTNTNKVLNYLTSNNQQHFTINELVGHLQLTSNTVDDALKTLIQQGKVKTFSIGNKEYFKIK